MTRSAADAPIAPQKIESDGYGTIDRFMAPFVSALALVLIEEGISAPPRPGVKPSDVHTRGTATAANCMFR